MIESCSTCHFGTPEAGMIKCRRFPPVLIAVKYLQVDQMQIESHYVFMTDDEWCGEWKLKS